MKDWFQPSKEDECPYFYVTLEVSKPFERTNSDAWVRALLEGPFVDNVDIVWQFTKCCFNHTHPGAVKNLELHCHILEPELPLASISRLQCGEFWFYAYIP